MAFRSGKNIVVGLDVGTTKICAAVAEIDRDNRIRIIGIGSSPSHGLRKGVVVNVESTVDSIGRAIDEAEEMSGVEIHSVFAGIAGGHIQSLNSRGVIAIARDSNEITQEDIDRAVNAAKAISIPMDREVIHTIPQGFVVDGQDGIKDPRGMSGARLEVDVHIITGAITSAQNIVNCVNRAGFEVEDIVLEPLASSIATLTQEEKDSGVILIDIGGGTSDFVVFTNGAIRHTDILAVGGDHVTNDISIGLKIPLGKAEAIKKKFGSTLSKNIKESEEFVVPGVVGRSASNMRRKDLAEIIEMRMEEVFSLVYREIDKTGLFDLIGSGIVLTGGASLMPGSLELASHIFKLPARLGKPRDVSGLVEVLDSPIFATGVGLTQYGFRYRELGGSAQLKGRKVFTQIVDRMKNWVGDYF